MTLKRKRILIILLVILTPLSIFFGFRLIKGYVTMPYSKIYSVLKDDRKCEALFTDENGRYYQSYETIKPGFFSRSSRDVNEGVGVIKLGDTLYRSRFVQSNITTGEKFSEYGNYESNKMNVYVTTKQGDENKDVFIVRYEDHFMTYEIEKYEGYDEGIYQQLKASWESKVSKC